jgi:hypothetical protein
MLHFVTLHPSLPNGLTCLARVPQHSLTNPPTLDLPPLLLLLLPPPPPHTHPTQEPPPPGKVEVLAYAPGFDRARTDDDLVQLYRDNMDPDLAPFRRKGGWSLDAFTDFVKVGHSK